MQVTPIRKIAPPVNLPYRKRAVMVIRHDKFIVDDAVTGVQTELPEGEAWAMVGRLNLEV